MTKAYESEHTEFMREWFKQHQEELQVIQTGRAMWWDKDPEDVAKRLRQQQNETPRKAYYYFDL